MLIVVAYIPTPEGDAALEAAVVQARAHRARLVVVNAARGEAATEPRRLHDDRAGDLARRLQATGLEHEIRREVREGDPGENVVQLAGDLGADMIVIGLRRRSATGKLLFGSNAQRILFDAPCPVLAVRAT